MNTDEYFGTRSEYPGKLLHDVNWVSQVAGDLFEGLFEQAQKDLAKGRGSAYFWIACPKSSLYSFLEQTLDTPPAPGRVASAEATASAIKRGNLPAVPLEGITQMVIDTDDTDAWYGAAKGSSKKRYIHAISMMLDKLEYVEGAIENNVEVRVTGHFSAPFRKVLNTFLQARLGNFATESAALLEAERALSSLRMRSTDKRAT